MCVLICEFVDPGTRNCQSLSPYDCVGRTSSRPRSRRRQQRTVLGRALEQAALLRKGPWRHPLVRICLFRCRRAVLFGTQNCRFKLGFGLLLRQLVDVEAARRISRYWSLQQLVVPVEAVRQNLLRQRGAINRHARLEGGRTWKRIAVLGRATELATTILSTQWNIMLAGKGERRGECRPEL